MHQEIPFSFQRCIPGSTKGKELCKLRRPSQPNPKLEVNTGGKWLSQKGRYSNLVPSTFSLDIGSVVE